MGKRYDVSFVPENVPSAMGNEASAEIGKIRKVNSIASFMVNPLWWILAPLKKHRSIISSQAISGSVSRVPVAIFDASIVKTGISLRKVSKN
jgi:hypothetical protein